MPSDAQLSLNGLFVSFHQNVATKEHKRHARGLIERLEARVHVGPPVLDAEITSAREFLRQNDFAPTSDYFGRLSQIQNRLGTRPALPCTSPGKRNYGGLAAGRWMQLQAIYDHVILSTCYEGDSGFKSGKIKLSHRFNLAGRIDFVELKFLRSLHPCLNGEVRTLVRVKDYANLRREWWAAEAFILPVLPQELIFLHPELFRFPRTEVLAWLVNIGHRLAEDLLQEWAAPCANGHKSEERPSRQLPLPQSARDTTARPIIKAAAGLVAEVETAAAGTAVLRYLSQNGTAGGDYRTTGLRDHGTQK